MTLISSINLFYYLGSTDPTKKKKFSVKRLLELSQHRVNPNCPIPDIYGNKLRLYSKFGITVNTKDGHFNSKKLMKKLPWTVSDEDLLCIEADSFYEDDSNVDIDEKGDDDKTSTNSSVKLEQFETTLDLEQNSYDSEQLNNPQELPKIHEEAQNLEYNESL